jgi:hypothetical protein
MLLGVYALHLVFLQVLMAGTPANVHPHSGAITNFKPLFHNHDRKHNSQPVNDPAVSYYTQLMKQGKEDRVTTQAPSPVCQVSGVVVPQCIVAVGEHSVPQPSQFHLNDYAFKRYSLFGVFLI